MAKKILIAVAGLIVLAAVGSYVWRLESQNADLKDRIEDLRNRAENLEGREGALEARAGKLETRAGNSESRAVSLEHRIDKSEKDTQRLQGRADDLSASISGCRSILSNCQIGVKGCQSGIKNCQSAIASCLSNIASRIEIDRCMLKVTYEREKEDLEVAHGMMGGSRISYAMLCTAKADFDNRWKRIAGDWFVSTARSEDERKLMQEYGVGVSDLQYDRAELVAVMQGWESTRGSRGIFLGNDLTFTNGVAKFYDNRSDWSSVGYPNGLPKEIHLLKEHIWVHEGNVFLFFATDIAQNFEDGYAGTDSEREIWFARFKDGLLKNYAMFRRGCGDWSDLRFHFEPDDDTIVITSTLSGNIAGGLGLGLREYTDVTTGKKSSQFGPSYMMVMDGDRRADANEPQEPNVNTNSPVALPDAPSKGQ